MRLMDKQPRLLGDSSVKIALQINFFKRKHEQDLAGKDLPKTSASARKSTRNKLMM